MNIALIGLDTSHVLHLTRLLNAASDSHAKVTMAYPGGSGRLSHSFDRVAKHTAELRDQHGVRMVASIAELSGKCDAYFVTSIDAGQHPEQLEAIVSEGRPVFIDKPFAHSLADARAMFELGRRHESPIFTTSALRYAPEFCQALAKARAAGGATGCDIYGPMEILEGAAGYFWYGIHAAELLFAAMGIGFESVSTMAASDFDVISVRWANGRLGTIRGSRVPHYIFGGTLHTAKGPITFELPEKTACYGDLLEQILLFIERRRSPIAEEETLEIVAMLEAAEKLRLSLIRHHRLPFNHDPMACAGGNSVFHPVRTHP